MFLWSFRKKIYIMKRLLLLLVLGLQLTAYSQHYSSSAEIYLGLRKLNTLGSVLYIAAHPDDENTRLITYYSRDRLYRTGYLSITRGDGGQNLIGDEQGVELGLIRTQELLAARRLDGGEQFFTRAFDFGYSKTPAETFSKWDKDKILSDVVWVIRKFQPDVIITRFPTTGEGGHGHHTASAILANEAFTAAADPGRYPSQLQWVQPWQAKRIFWNGFNFGNASIPEGSLTVDAGGYNPILGKSYGEIAGESRSQHKSQGFGATRSRGEFREYLRLTGGKPAVNDPFEDVITSWKRVPGGEKIEKQVQAIISAFDFTQPELSVPALVKLYQSLQQMPAGYWRDKKLEEVQELVEAASGLWIESFTSTPHAVQGDSLRINLVLNNRLGLPAVLKKVEGFPAHFPAANFITGRDTTLRRNQNYATAVMVMVSNQPTQPYWLEEKMNTGYFNVNRQELIGQPDIQPGLEVLFTIQIAGENFVFRKPVLHKYTDPVKGELYQPLTVIPAANVITSPEVLVFRKNQPLQSPVVVQINANKKIKGEAEGHVRSMQYDLTTKEEELELDKGTAKSFSFELDSKGMKQVDKDYLYGSVLYGEGKERESAYLAMRNISYDHIPTIRYFFADAVTLLNIDLKTQGKRIGYITGAGDKVPEALEQMGYEVVLLGEKELLRNSLEQYDAIISGVRAYNTNEWLNRYHDKLMQYVEQGGNLIVQYNTSSNIGPVRAKIGPYPFNISRSRITDEQAEVRFLDPKHQVLNFPNTLGPKDFEGWVQERSIYHAAGYDSNFQAIFSMNDPGEKSDKGSLVIARHGKGYFTYTGIVFFRQLPAAVPGAYRLLANLIALNQKKEF